MSDSPLLAGPRQGWLGALLDRGAPLPVLGKICARMQVMRRKRFRASLRENPVFRQKLEASPLGKELQEALSLWLALPPHTSTLPPLAGARGNPNVRCSVIINTVDRAEDLTRTLKDLHSQWSSGLDELIIVLGPTSDDTRERIAQSGFACRVIECPERNLAISRNLGLTAAVGEFVAFLDDDASPCDGWLEGLLDPLIKYPSAGTSAGFALDGEGRHFRTRYVVSDRLGRSSWWDTEDDARQQIARIGSSHTFLTATGCNMAFRRDRLLAHGGFDSFYAYFLEETDLVLRLLDAGHPCLVAPQSVVFHRHATNAARSPAASMDARRVIIRSQLHFARKFSAAFYSHKEVEDFVWQRILINLGRIGWDHPTHAAQFQADYLRGISADLSGRQIP